MPLIDLTGNRYSLLLVLRQGEHISGTPAWVCLCDCGSTKLISGCNLRELRTTSCGCIGGNLTHGQARSGSPTIEYVAWQNMKKRCYSPVSPQYLYYGARGISVCDEWLNSFPQFFADMGLKPDLDMSLDRIDNDGPYAPWNCRWATAIQQRHNRRDTNGDNLERRAN